MKTAAFPTAQPTLSFPTVSQAAPKAASGSFFKNAEKNSLPWSFSALLIQTTVIAPLVLWTMSLAGGGDWQFALALMSSFAVLIPILSALSVRVVLPVFASSVVVNLGIILFNAAQIFLK
ncbi:hypothetical protein [Umezakia ovalisporum]|uniref:Uncharacterized protein n=1 Tax=Umezakia ovalisporum FSS-43 TaxID=2740520 RepID=A0ABT6K4G8_9CYAN|nr:hypothetical protein [Umezakia ovalisporum]MDH6057191.1 hypothetical protein [Umezakia ovalisporum FSS-43]